MCAPPKSTVYFRVTSAFIVAYVEALCYIKLAKSRFDSQQASSSQERLGGDHSSR